jgi:hypothetical protein
LHFCSRNASKLSTWVEELEVSFALLAHSYHTLRKLLGPKAALHTPAYVSTRSIRQHTSAYVSTRSIQHTPAYVSTCAQRLTISARAAYVSMRQHTSAYVCMRQHTSAPAPSGWRSQHAQHRQTSRRRALSPAPAYVRQHTSAYVSAYVSTRQHTSESADKQASSTSPAPACLIEV